VWNWSESKISSYDIPPAQVAGENEWIFSVLEKSRLRAWTQRVSGLLDSDVFSRFLNWIT
jgi:hypothetical protein